MSSLLRPRLQQGGVQSKINMYGGVLFLQNASHNEKVQVQNYWMHKNEKTLFCSGQSRKFSGSQRNPLTTRRSRKGNNTGTNAANYSPTQQKVAVSAKPQKCSYASPPQAFAAAAGSCYTSRIGFHLFTESLLSAIAFHRSAGMQAQGLLGLCKYSLEREG